MILACCFAVGFGTTSEDAKGTIDVLTPGGRWVRATAGDDGVIRSPDGLDVGSTALAWTLVSGESPDSIRSVSSMTILSDGQVIVGTFSGFHRAETGTIARWKHPNLGLIDIPVERTRFIQLQPIAALPPEGETDELVLRNGDRIRGFIETFADPIVIESDGTKREIPIERVAGLSLISASTPATGIRAWLKDGSVIEGSSISGGFQGAFVINGIPLVVDRAALPLELDDIDCVTMAPKRILTLATLDPVVSEPTTTAFPRAEYPTPKLRPSSGSLGAASIEIRGPERLIYKIPQGFSVLSAQAEIPPSLRAWADCTIVLRQNGQELARYALTTKDFRAEISVTILPGPLEIEIEEASGGPIGDTVLLRRAILIAVDRDG